MEDQYTPVHVSTHQYQCTSVHISTHQYTSVHISTHQYTPFFVDKSILGPAELASKFASRCLSQTYQKRVHIPISTCFFYARSGSEHFGPSELSSKQASRSVDWRRNMFVCNSAKKYFWEIRAWRFLASPQYTSVHFSTHQYTSVHFSTLQYAPAHISAHLSLWIRGFGPAELASKFASRCLSQTYQKRVHYTNNLLLLCQIWIRALWTIRVDIKTSFRKCGLTKESACMP